MADKPEPESAAAPLSVSKEIKDSAHVERVLSDSEGMHKDHVDQSRVDKEIAAYAGEEVVEIDEETSKRLRRMIDKRVLVIMICTYFLQALDKGTMSFSSIMGIREYAGLEDGNKVHTLSPSRPLAEATLTVMPDPT